MDPYYESNLGRLYHGDCVPIMSMLEEAGTVVDLVVTSPPYDNLRKYSGYKFDFEKTADGLTRLLAEGGVIVWVVGDATVKGSETGTSFRQALYFRDECKLDLYDTMIYHKHGMPTDPRLRYFQRFEYMFVFSKGRPKSYNPIADVPSSKRKQGNGSDRRGDVLITTDKKYQTPDFSVRGNVWTYDPRNVKSGHPASFPLDLARDHIASWSSVGDLVLDPLIGSGMTAEAAETLGRRWIGCEISEDYCELTSKRIRGGSSVD